MTLVIDLDEATRDDLPRVGAKGAQLGALGRLDGLLVPDGCCVTTDAYARVVTGNPAIAGRIDGLSEVAADDRDTVRARSAEVRQLIEGAAVPSDVVDAIGRALERLGEQTPFAVRSSATAEDLPGSSFAGQYDSYLDVVGLPAVVDCVRRCWASLFTERAVAYRRRSGFAERDVAMAVVVQRMVAADAAGVLFTADPVTSNRTIAVAEAVRGTGEALVSGRVRGDVYRVDREGTVDAAVRGPQRVLTDAHLHRLVALGRRIEASLGRPQDVEWCLSGDDLAIVQSRPITTLFPVPERDDEHDHVYLSVGHQQMMPDAMRPLGLSFWQLTTRAPMVVAGSRLFVDVTRRLAAPASRAELLQLIDRSDPLTADALRTVLQRDGYLPTLPDDAPAAPVISGPSADLDPDPTLVPELIERSEASVAAAARALRTVTGTAMLDAIRDDLPELRRNLFDPRGHQVFMTAIEATWWLTERLSEWLGDTTAVDVLTRSVPHNVTSEMGLALLDVADAIRPHREVVAFLQRVAKNDLSDDLLDGLAALTGGRQAREALEAWLDTYGMRCAGEIDITRTRWRERPALLVPVLLGHVANAEPGAAARRFEQGRRAAERTERELLDRIRVLPGGARKAEDTKRRIDRVRAFIGYREYPKYAMVSRYFLYKRALLREADRLVHERVLRDREDLYFLTFDEVCDVVRTRRVDQRLIAGRRSEFRHHAALPPPRVLTSDGEALTGSYRRDGAPAGALPGLAVSAGTVEGRARVVTDMAQADLAPGDILVTAYTDPSWTPLFLTAGGLVTEVGGLMTHGAVIAREYGLPGVVGVEQATRLIRDGQRIRVDGSRGLVEVLSAIGD